MTMSSSSLSTCSGLVTVFWDCRSVEEGLFVDVFPGEDALPEQVLVQVAVRGVKVVFVANYDRSFACGKRVVSRQIRQVSTSRCSERYVGLVPN